KLALVKKGTGSTRSVPNEAIKLMLFPFSLDEAAWIWLEKEPPHSIFTWEVLISKIVNQFFPPSNTTNLKNDITRFQQKSEETFSDAWDRFKDLLRKFPHHGFLELHQIDTFYNALTQSNQDSLNAAAGGNLLNRTPRDAMKIIENKSKVRGNGYRPQGDPNYRAIKEMGPPGFPSSPQVPLILRRPFLRTAHALIDVYGEELTLRVNDEAITFKFGHISRYTHNHEESFNRIDVIDVACEEYAQEVLGFLDNSKSGNPTPSLDPIITTSSPSFTPFEGGDFKLEEIEACLTSDSIPSGIDDADFDPRDYPSMIEDFLCRILSRFPRPSYPLINFSLGKSISCGVGCISQIYDPCKMVKRCEDTNLVLDWEKCHFMVKEGIVLGHKISKSWIEVDRAKVDVIAKLPHPTSVEENLTADHLSRLENPNQGDLEKKEINETFPLEDLGVISSYGDSSTPMHDQPKDTNELFQKLLEDLKIINKELAEYINSPCWNRPTLFNNDEEHYVQYKEYLENHSNEIAASNFNQEKKGPPQDSDIHQLIREECCIKVYREQKKNMEDTMLELIEVCRQKEFYCMHNDVDDLIKSAINSKLLSINFKCQRLDKKKQEVKNISSVHAITPVLPIEEPEYSLSMGYEHFSIISKMELDKVTKSCAKNLLPIPSEYEVTSDNKCECDVPFKDESSLVFTTFSNPLFDDNDDDESLSAEHDQPKDTNELFQKLLEDLKIINKELAEYINSPCWNRPTLFNNDEEHYVQYKEYLENHSNEIAASNFNQEKKGPPQDSDIHQLIREECCIKVYREQKKNMEDTMLELIEYGYEHLSIISEIELDKVTKSCAKNLLPIPSEYEVTFDNKCECDVPFKDESSLVFTTFSNPLFDDNDDDESLSDEVISMKDFKVYSNPLFDNEEINFDKLDLHYFNDESDFVESFSNSDILIDSSLKFGYLKEFSGALMPTSIVNEERIRREHEEEEIDIFTGTNDLLPPSIESDDYDSEGDIHVLEELLVNDSIPILKNESSDLIIRMIRFVINNIDELNEDECFDSGNEIDVFADVEDDDYFLFIFVIRIFLLALGYMVQIRLVHFCLKEPKGKDYAKIAKEQSNPDKIEHEIAKNAQKPD
nr:reverse transcriptase domain-containing protein [Tanacetum cinerariifolium]